MDFVTSMLDLCLVEYSISLLFFEDLSYYFSILFCLIFSYLLDPLHCFSPWVLPFISLWLKSQIVTIQIKAFEQYFYVVLFVMLYNMVLTFESVDKIRKYYPRNSKATEQYFPVILGFLCCTYKL